MAYKSIIDIDVDDSKFQAFLSQFDRFKDKAKDIPASFEKLEDRITKTKDFMKGFGDHFAHVLKSMAEGVRGISGGFGKMPKEIHKSADALKRVKDTGRDTFVFLGREIDKLGKSFGIFSKIATGIAAVSFAGLALYGHESDVMTERYKRAKMAGMKPGVQSALDTTFGPFLSNAQGTVAAFGAAYRSYQGAAALARVLGPAYDKMTKAQAFQAAMEKAQRVAKENPTKSLAALDKTYGFDLIGISAADLELLKNTKTNMAALSPIVQKQSKVLNFSTAAGKRMEMLNMRMSQMAVQLSTELGQTLSHGAPVVKSAISYLSNVIESGAKKLNLLMQSVGEHKPIPVKQVLPKWTPKPIVHAAQKQFDGSWVTPTGKTVPESARQEKNAALTDAAGAVGGLAVLSRAVTLGKLALAPVGAGVGSMLYSQNLGDSKAFHKAMIRGYLDNIRKEPWYKRIHNPMDIEAYNGDASYLNKGNGNRYAAFSSTGAAYRKAAQLVRGYGRHTLLGIMSKYEGSTPSADLQAAARHASSFGMHQRLDLNNPETMARVLTAIRVTEQPHKRSNTQIYDSILPAIKDRLSKVPTLKVPAQTDQANKPLPVHASSLDAQKMHDSIVSAIKTGVSNIHIHIHQSSSPAGNTRLQAHMAAR